MLDRMGTFGRNNILGLSDFHNNNIFKVLALKSHHWVSVNSLHVTTHMGGGPHLHRMVSTLNRGGGENGKSIETPVNKALDGL